MRRCSYRLRLRGSSWSKEVHLHRRSDHVHWRRITSFVLRRRPNVGRTHYLVCLILSLHLHPCSDGLSGLGNGFNTATTPLWLCELLPAKRRGRDVSTAGNLIAFGIIIAYYFNIGLSYTTGPVQWRLPIAFQGVFIILQLIWTKFLPESPRWLIKHGRHEEAIDILAQLQGKDIPCDAPTVLEQKRLIDEALALENEGGPWKFSEVFQNGPLKIRRRYIMVIGIQAMQQLAGINILVYYAPHTLTNDMGFSAREALYVGAGISVTYWVFSFSQVFFLDQMGRRRPLIVGGLLQAVCFLCVSIPSKIAWRDF